MPLVPTAQTTDRDASSPPPSWLNTWFLKSSVARRTQDHIDVTWRRSPKGNAHIFLIMDLIQNYFGLI